MATYRIKTLVLLSISLMVLIPASTQTVVNNLIFHTTQGQKINVHGGVISVNGKDFYKLEDDGIIYTSKRNKIIENSGTVFLFLEVNRSPNLDRLYVFRISTTSVDSITNAISSDLKDLDGDTYLEFGGSDLTEEHPSRDSMYYIPSRYYEIRNGQILYDSSCTIKIDKKVNGIYLPDPLDKDGNCCKAILKPGKKNETIIVDRFLKSERIDGPANIRDTINGKLLFKLDDNVPVSTTDTANKWYRISLRINLDSAQLNNLVIQNGSELFSNGIKIGIALETIHLKETVLVNQHLNGVLRGFTAESNIKQQTIPEKVLSRIIRQNGSMDVSDLDDFIEAFQFSVSTNDLLFGYYLDDGVGYGSPHPLRLFLAFNDRRLFGVVHSRKLDYSVAEEYTLKRGYSLTVVGHQDQKLVNKFIKQFNEYIIKAE
jgi:hypothetical protein